MLHSLILGDSLSFPPNSQPCAFKHETFSDWPLLTLSVGRTPPSAVLYKLMKYVFHWTRRGLADLELLPPHMLRQVQAYLEIHLLEEFEHHSRLFTSIYTASRPVESNRCQQHTQQRGFNALPSELRQRVFAYLLDRPMKVVGYRNGDCDAFLFKDRGFSPLPVMLTCKQFCVDMQYTYFRNITVHIKSAVPSQFSGDMSAFANERFRTSVSKVKIVDGDESRRAKMAAAFESAQIEFGGRGSAGSRKNAYYFMS